LMSQSILLFFHTPLLSALYQCTIKRFSDDESFDVLQIVTVDLGGVDSDKSSKARFLIVRLESYSCHLKF
jgi:hypothetical protein